MTKHVIELNGQHYDATTGTPISAPAKKLKAVKAKGASPRGGTQHLDGFSRRPSAVKPPTYRVSHSVHAKPAKSQTLMRAAVKKPAPSAKIHAKTAASPAVSQGDKPQPTIGTVQPGRAIRANVIGQSNLISKFGKTKPGIKSEVLTVKPAPIATRHNTTSVKQNNQQPVATAAQVTAAASDHAHITKADPFKHAIEQSVSHNQTKLKKTKVHHRIAHKLQVSPKFVTFTGTVLAVLAVSSVIAYQNMPELAMKVAATRAGFNASLPAYQPAGFALAGPIKYDHGEVTVNYKSNSDERVFNVVQKNSSWNSETLLENFVTTTKQPYQTFQANGRTIYIYDGNKATWVDGGVWFNIDGKTNLNSDQLLRIADSL